MKKRLLLFTMLFVFTGAVAEAATQAWVWADQPASPSYAPSGTYRYNPTGGAITITRSATGTYQVRFTGLISIAGTGGNVQVTPYGGGTSNCRVVSWTTAGADQLVNVRCNAPSGAAADSLYTVLYTFN